MATEFLKGNEVLQLLCNSDDDCVSSIFSDNEIGDLVVVDTIVNNDSDEEEKVTFNQNFI